MSDKSSKNTGIINATDNSFERLITEADVPVLVDSEVGKILAALNWRGMNRERIMLTATVKLGWNEKTPSMLHISKVICWEFLGVGGEIGNTTPKNQPAPAGK